MNKIIIPTGYMASGSSAVTDLVREFKGYEAVNNHYASFEYVFLHCPGGLFDLEDKLLLGNNALRSDEALRTFEKTMMDLYKCKFWWPANYKKNFSPEFMNVTKKYIQRLTQYHFSTYWYMQQKYTPLMFFKMCIRKIIKILSAERIKLPIPLKYNKMLITLISPQEFYAFSKAYLKKLFCLLGIEEHNLVLDQLLLPFNLWRMDNYFDKNVECIVVDRDPRDMFLSNKYIWSKNDSPVPYPTDPIEFCGYYRKIRESEKKAESAHIHRFHFEDLIYYYDENLEKIYKILCIEKEMHVRKFEFFNPKVSINNTQLFLFTQYKEEAEIIEKLLPEYLYPFPYEWKTNNRKVF